jgi:hypothetical protein
MIRRVAKEVEPRRERRRAELHDEKQQRVHDRDQGDRPGPDRHKQLCRASEVRERALGSQ